MKKNTNFISKNLASDIINEVLLKGGDFVELFLEHKVCNYLTVLKGEVDKIISGIDYGIGLRIFKGYNAIYLYTNDLSRENLLKIVKESLLILKNKENINITNNYTKNKNINNIVKDYKNLDFTETIIENNHFIKKFPNIKYRKDIINLLKEASERSFNYSSLITETNNGYLDEIQNILIINSEGLFVEDERVRTRLFVSAVASNLKEKQVGSFSPGASKGVEIFEDIDINYLGKESAKKAVRMLEADFCPSGKMPVVIDKGFGGVIFHEACGHSLEATSVAKKASEFSDKKGMKIASDIVTIIDDGTIKNAWGSQNIDDEGNKTKKNILIEKGILKSFLVDKLNGLKMGEKSTGSGRRQSYKFPPTSRMSNTYIKEGKDKEEDIIANTEYGLYAKTMGGGSVETITGDFNFSVTEAYLIKNGKITEPVRGATLIGKGSEVIMNIDKVSTIVDHGQGMCGSLSGSIPVNCGQPMIRVKEIIVGGRK